MQPKQTLRSARSISSAFWIYFAFLIMGIIVPFSQFFPWLFQNGLNVTLFIQQLFSNPIGAFFGCDVIIAVLFVIVTAIMNMDRLLPLQRILIILGSLLGASVGFPLYMMMIQWNRDHVQKL